MTATRSAEARIRASYGCRQADEWLDFLTDATQTGDDAHSVFLRETRGLEA